MEDLMGAIVYKYIPTVDAEEEEGKRLLQLWKEDREEMYSEQVQRELIERFRKKAECFDYDQRPDIATDYEIAADLIEDLKEKYDNSRASTKWLMKRLGKVVTCKDCVHGTRVTTEDGEQAEVCCNGVAFECDHVGIAHSPDFFCAEGERK
jgi:hypothetical protein